MSKFSTKLKARTYECDMYGHVNNAVYLQYCEAARIELLNAIGYSLKDLMHKKIMMPIVRVEIDFKKQIFADEEIWVTVEWAFEKNTSVTFRHEIVKMQNNELAAIAHVTWVTVDAKGKPIRFPAEMKNKFLQLIRDTDD
ncbi:MAG: YbgC/FadM family acyl-CoA thioesterase [Caldithrix sp.]|nr:YbgC/FadM family acyl-CoA thioesterase [Caldithrix sp.]